MNNRIYSFEWIRIISSVIILYFHARGWIGLSFGNGKVINNFFANGAIVMSLFFMLSGFGLHYSHCKTDFFQYNAIVSFYKKRLISIYPAYIIHMVYMVLISDLTLKRVLLIAPLHAGMLQMSVYDSRFLNINASVWYLSVASLTYLMFPYTSMLIKKMKIQTKIVLILYLYLVCASGGIFPAWFGFDIMQPYFSPLIRGCEFLIGVLLCELCMKINIKKQFGIIALTLWIVGFICIQDYFVNKQIPFWSSSFYSIPMYSVLLFGLFFVSSNSVLNKIAKTRIVQYMAKVSFTIYLVQPFCFLVYRYFESKVAIVYGSGFERVLMFTTITISFAIIYYIIIKLIKEALINRI